MMTGPANPWHSLPHQPPYVLPDDKHAIDQFNLAAKTEYRIRLEIFPEPYLGQPEAPVVVLNYNPGFKDRDLVHHQKALFAHRSRENLLHVDVMHPFYLLDPTLAPIADRTDWWDRKLRWFLEDPRLGDSPEARRFKVANEVLCVEFFPYHSVAFDHRKLSVPSQKYSFALVKMAIQRKAVILMRGWKHWLTAVPELGGYAYEPNSLQNAAFSPNNFLGGYEAAIEALRKV